MNTHTACALAVASGDADAAIGLQAAAAHQALGFLPLFNERYDLVIPDDQLSVVQPLVDTLVAGAFRRWSTGLAGYEMNHAGEEISP